MLSTSGLSPVAQELAPTLSSGESGSDATPVAPECPSTAMASSSSVAVGDADGVSLALVVVVGGVPGSPDRVSSLVHPARTTRSRAAAHLLGT
ncbi:hypothetical protein GCM10011376_39490 [Nocardioides flavus (ex Wang et al. 2016)]|uniref:Uncharacterized protein n=1 Tax=Nocardioides flavus (ex Wang et al. 2016) TaxID=2058780 RepID=A0ABQ3HT02_9ACTN|nr:hypothetical protein GCM10011376_39490 [Nocardioides flavus (ex Wang et al. 2016)]